MFLRTIYQTKEFKIKIIIIFNHTADHRALSKNVLLIQKIHHLLYAKKHETKMETNQQHSKEFQLVNTEVILFMGKQIYSTKVSTLGDFLVG